jgi:hypothetical protein
MSLPLDTTPLLPRTTPARSNIPDRLVHGGGALVGLVVGGYVVVKVVQSESVPDAVWAALGLAALGVFTGIWGFFRPRNVTIISPVPNQADVVTTRVLESLQEASAKLERLVGRYSQELHRQNGVVSMTLERGPESEMRDVELAVAIQPTLEDLVRGFNSHIDSVEKVIDALESQAQPDRVTPLALKYLGELDRKLDACIERLRQAMPERIAQIPEQEATQEPIEDLKNTINAKLLIVGGGMNMLIEQYEELDQDLQTMLQANIKSPMKFDESSDDDLMARVNAVVTSSKRAPRSSLGLRSGTSTPYSTPGRVRGSSAQSSPAPSVPSPRGRPPAFSLSSAVSPINGDVGNNEGKK